MHASRSGAALALALLLAGCGSTTSPEASSPGASPTSASDASPTPASSPVVVVESPSPGTGGEPTPVAATGWAWVSPAAGIDVPAYAITLAAKPIAPAGAVAVTRVVFRVAWSDGRKAACSATKAGATGAWSCTANLVKLGVTPGKVTFSFDVQDASGGVARGAGGGRAATYAVVPPRPAGLRWTKVSDTTAADGTETLVERLSWSEPAGYATEFRLYGVTECLNGSAKTNGKPCLVEHMSVPSTTLRLIKKAAGTGRSMVIRTVIAPGVCPGTLWCGDFYAAVLAAYDAYGESVLAIARSETVCWECTY